MKRALSFQIREPRKQNPGWPARTGYTYSKNPLTDANPDTYVD